MRNIEFDKDLNSFSFNTEEQPVVFLQKINFKTTDQNWTNRLFSATLIIKVIGFDEKGSEIQSYQTPFCLGTFITLQQKTPVLIINEKVSYDETFGIVLKSSCDHWETTIEITNLNLVDTETLIIQIEENDTSSFLSLYKDFESIVKQILEANHFEVKYQKGKDYDFLADLNNTFAYVEVKLYSTKLPRLDLLKAALHKLLSLKDNKDAKLLLIVSNYVTQSLKDEVFRDFGIVIWDIKVLFALAIDFSEIYYKLESILIKAFKIPIDEFLIVDNDFKKTIVTNLIESQTKVQTKPHLKEGQRLYLELSNINPGKEEATDYENKCIEILKYLFDNKTDLTLWEKQLSTDDGLNRNDLLCRIASYENNFWAELSNDFHTRYIVFEFKNYTKAIKQGQIFTTEKYLYLTALRSVCFLIARNGADKNAIKAAKGALKEAGKLIIVIDNSDVNEMLKLKDNGDDPSLVLRQRIDETLIALNR
jgi:hypothetical protein